jgi:hypothetical protein
MAVEFNVGFEISGDGEDLYLVRTLKDGSEDREAVDQGKIEAIGEACKRNDVLRKPGLEKKIGELLFGVLNGDRQALARALMEAEGFGERLRVCLAVAGQARMWPFELLYNKKQIGDRHMSVLRC